MKSKFCEKYFDGNVKPKHLREFKAKTPLGNIIEGYISRKPNLHLGSLVITHITEKNGKSYDTEQFVQAFPKIHYWDNRHRLKEDASRVSYFCQEKLDGTCLIIYSLNDDNGNSIEIVPKTRGRAVADDHILDMYNLVDKKAIYDFFEDSQHLNDSLMFELFGVLNKHEISHIETYIDISLIGAFVDGSFLDYYSISSNFELDNFKKPEAIFTIYKNHDKNSFSIIWAGHNSRLKNYRLNCDEKFSTLFDAIQEVKSMLKQINENYFKNNNRRVIEGVVINGEHFKSGQMYLKIKPEDIENEAKRQDFVPRRFILKEVRKYFDEFGSNVKKLYDADETHYINYIKLQLKEEFDYEQIEDPRTRKRIKSVFMDVWDSKIAPASLQNICEDLIKENPDSTITELMKLFASQYPTKKSKSRFAYNIFTSVKKKS